MLDPFQERCALLQRAPQRLLGAHVAFESNSAALLRLVDSAYAGVPAHRLGGAAARLRIRLLLNASVGRHARTEPPPLTMLSGTGLLTGATDASNFVVMAPAERAALVVVSPRMLRSAYHTRYELIEFAVYTLAARVQELIPLHAACVGLAGRAALLMGPSGAGKSTVALHCLLAGFDFLSEDSVFVTPHTLRATGIANFLHVRANSLRWLDRSRDLATIRRSPVIVRRSGVKKFEVDLRHSHYRLADTAQRLVAIVFLSQESAAAGELLRPLTQRRLMARLLEDQAYATEQRQWQTFKRRLATVRGYELCRGKHPAESVLALRRLLGAAHP
jgi:hypothetical protein